MTKLAAKEFNDPRSSHSAVGSNKSQCKTLDRSEVLYLNPALSLDFRQWFAPVLACWLREGFQNPEHVAMAFGIRNSTAWNWWNADNRASGDAVARIFMSDPNAAIWFREKWSAHVEGQR